MTKEYLPESARASLNRLYDNMRERLEIQRKIGREESVLLYFFRIKTNDAYRVLTESGLKNTTINEFDLDQLLERNMIRTGDSADNIVLTAFGLWEAECSRETLDLDGLLLRIDSKMFDLFREGQSITEKEKVLLFAMMAVRSFGEKSVLDLKRDESVVQTLKPILESSMQFLVECGSVSKLDNDSLFGGKGNEHPVSQLIRHTDALFRKTKGVYRTLGREQKYYLDVDAGKTLSQEKLLFLLEMLFPKVFAEDTKNRTQEFLNSVAYTSSSLLFNVDDHKFAHPTYDREIIRALEKHYLSKRFVA